MTIIYVDLTFILNTVINGLALLCALRLSGLPVRWWPLFLGAALGGLYAVFAAIPPYDILRAFAAKCMVSFLMVRIAYGKDCWILRRYLLFLLVSCGLSGACEAVKAVLWRTENPWTVLLVAGFFCALVLCVVFHRSSVPQEVEALEKATIHHNGKKVSVLLFYDTGNTLRDPKYGHIICVVWEKALRPLGELCCCQIPFQSLGQQGGELDYFYCDQFVVGGKSWNDYPIGISPHPLSDGGGYVGLWNKGEGEESG